MDTKALLKNLADLPLTRLYKASYAAQMRLQLYFTGRTQEMLLEFGERASGAITKAGGSSGVLDGTRGFGLQSELLRLWGDMFTQWQAEFQQLRREAAWIPFGVLAATHERMLKPAVQQLSEALVDDGGVFSSQIRLLVDAASEYVFEDGLNLSGRIWKLDRASRDIINQILMDGIANQKSAWQIAQGLEEALGANENCPRWTSYRLYGLTAKEKLSNPGGLLSGKDCDSRGVSYNALRLARTELQRVHGMATDKMMAMQPWVEKEQIHLSASHPEKDICDSVVEGGEGGKGIYAVGEIVLPLHPHCFCMKNAVLMDEQAFTSRLRGWMKSEESWPEMDTYASLFGGNLETSVMSQGMRLAVWLFSDDLAGWLK